jgi:hypothetical protein
VKVRLNGSSSRERVAQNFDKSLTGEIIGVTGVFKGQLGGGRHKLSQSSIGALVITVYFHAIPARTLPEKSPSRVAREGDTPAKHA